MTQEVMKEIVKPENWSPNYSVIARKTGKSVGSVYGLYQRRKQKGKIQVYVKELADSEVKNGTE